MIEVIEGGLFTTIQDFPGRVGYWGIGIPPSGPMDPFSFRIANRLVGNTDDEAGLEITAIGPKLHFTEDATIALAGARLQGTLNGSEVPWWEAVKLRKGDILSLGRLREAGFRAYLAIAGGVAVPDYLGSKSTFPDGHFGGHEGRPLKKGDILSTNHPRGKPVNAWHKKLCSDIISEYGKEWVIGVLPGPHEAPDFFTYDDVDMFYNTPWCVHHNSNRLGIRLLGPCPQFTRLDGGEGGRHPSNIHDCAYAIGTINFTGDMPIILTVDGPSLGGFVSIATVITSEFWKLGQVAPNNLIRFKKVSYKQAVAGRWEQEKLLCELIS